MTLKYCFLIFYWITSIFFRKFERCMNDHGQYSEHKISPQCQKGTQTIEKDYVSYPPAEKHPDGFFFNVNIRSRFNENLDLEEIARDRYTQPKLENI